MSAPSPPPSTDGVDRAAILRAVAEASGVPVAEWIGERPRRRWQRAVVPRRVAAVLLRESGLTYQAIGRVLELDHSTVIYHISAARDGFAYPVELNLSDRRGSYRRRRGGPGLFATLRGVYVRAVVCLAFYGHDVDKFDGLGEMPRLGSDAS